MRVRRLGRLALALCACLALCELGVRILGLADVPIRDANRRTGYIPIANQSGRFLRNDWYINAQHMISRRDFHARGRETVISGDSVVFGGNPLAQDERVGDQLGQLIADEVFASADGSWALKNQLNYFFDLPAELRAIERVIFILNSADFEQPSSWRCFSFHPTQAPVFHLLFIARKYLYPECYSQTPPQLIVDDYDLAGGVTKFVDAYPNTEILVLLYQDRKEWNARTSLRRKAGDIFPTDRIAVHELLDFPHLWHEAYYADGIHPTADGARALAKVLHAMIDADGQ